jgi:alanyl-tRNA synthetase
LDDQKAILRERFSSDYQKYYFVDLFKRKGYTRKRCENCRKFFWTLREDKNRCDDQPCTPYSFIGEPPAKKRLDYINSWNTIEKFFIDNKHASIKRYPVVSRWRPDLFFTVASIIDFQRIEGGKMVFELPSNPLVIPQICLRFNDIPSVGISGKHYTSFCMVGQHSIADKEGYWKDRCIDLDFELVTKAFGIPEEELSFIENVWLGYGAFGYSLEFFVRGLELGNAVFTAFEGEPNNYVEMKEKVVDMGAGLERFCWITQGTPTAYDSSFSYVLAKMKEVFDIEYDQEFFSRYSRVAGSMNIDEYENLSEARRVISKYLGVEPSQLSKQLEPVEAIYSIIDHAQTLLFAITDGLLPSNLGGGYNLRVLFRRAESFVKRFKFKISLLDIANWHIDYLSDIYPELKDHRDDVAKILNIESSRYSSSLLRASGFISSLIVSKKELSTDDLVRLYDSDGITPEQLIEAGVKISLPENFYERVLSRHITQKIEEKKLNLDINDLPSTKLLFYDESETFKFEATVLKIFESGYIVLDKTAFYPRGGGQEPDHGNIDGSKVVDVEKYGDVVLHKLEGRLPKVGSKVKGEVDSERREKIKRIHTATHVLNGSSRRVLGRWVWQHSAFKEEDHGRIDITHFSHLTEQEVQKIEDLANEIVMKNLLVTTAFMPRKEAEEKYSFGLYQGGVVPSKLIRVVNIGNWDVQACGGTHTKTTGEIGLIKIVKTERIQDGVERLHFLAGHPAIKYVHEIDSTIGKLSSLLNTQRENVIKIVTSLTQELEDAKRREKALGQRLIESTISEIQASSKEIKGVKLYLIDDPDLNEELIIVQGQRCIEADQNAVYVCVYSTGASARVICFAGTKAIEQGASANIVVKEVAKIVGGSGGGSKEFAQGGGSLVNKIEEAKAFAHNVLSSIIRG